MNKRTEQQSALEHALLWGAPAVTVILLVLYVTRHEFAVDFQDQYWIVGHRLLIGGNPYDWTHAQIASGVGAFPYPALSAILFVPFALIPHGVAAALWVTALMLAVPASLMVLRVRDWRLYALAFLWWPVIIGWQTGNLTLLLVLGLALLWRHRDRDLAAGLLVALVISLKPFLWPVGLWLLATRRYRAAGWAVALGLGLNLVAWGAIGFGQLSHYLTLDSQVTSILHRYGYGLWALAVRAGLPGGAGTGLMIAVALALTVLCVWLGRQRRDAAALLVAVDLTLAASPLVWTHYLALLIVPLAVLRPRLSLEWLLPLVLWLCPGGLQVSEWQALLGLIVTAAVNVLLLRQPVAQRRAPVSRSDQRRTGQAHVLATAQGGERAG